nr:hypothetical protein [Tanacetum cinerariifolium]
MLSKNKLGSGNKRLKGRHWIDYDVKSSKEMLRNFMYADTDEDLFLLPKEMCLDDGIGSPFFLINTEPPLTVVEATEQLVENNADSIGSPQQAVVDNVVNHIARKLLKAMKQIKGECEVLKEKEKSKDQECKELRIKCEATIIDFDKNQNVVALLEKIVNLQGEVKDYRVNFEKMLLEIQKWSGYQSDDMGKLITKLVNVSIFYGRCHAFKEVVKMKEPFDMKKVKGYMSSYKQEHTKAGNDLVTTTFPFLTDIVVDPYASVEVLLSKKPWILQRLSPTRTQMPTSSDPSQKATQLPAQMSPPPQCIRLFVLVSPDVLNRVVIESLHDFLHLLEIAKLLIPFLMLFVALPSMLQQCSTAMARYFMLSRAVGSGPKTLTPPMAEWPCAPLGYFPLSWSFLYRSPTINASAAISVGKISMNLFIF